MNRILFASHSAHVTGAPQVVYNIASHLDRAQFAPLVLFPENGPVIDRFRAADIPTAVIDIGDSRWGRLHIPMIEALCLAKGIDLVHANTLLGFPFVAASERRGIPCLWHIHEMLGSGLSFDLKEDEFAVAVERASRIVTVSHASRQRFEEYCRSLGVSAPEAIVVHNGVGVPESFRPYEPADPVKLLCVGNLQPHKGYHILIDAVAVVAARGRRVALTVLGDGDPAYLLRLWEQSIRAGVNERLHFLTAELDVGRRIRDADMVVNPSLVENFSLAIAEAMAHAKPVVATDIGGTKELLTDGETGALVPAGDPDALAHAIITFIENPEFARRCGEKAREHIERNLTTAKQAAQFQEVYAAMLSSGRPTRDPSETVPALVDLLSEALVSINEKFRALDMHNATVDYELNMIPKLLEDKFREAYDHMKALDKKMDVIAGNQKHSAEQLANLMNDLRSLETVVDNLLQQLPFRIMRTMKRMFTR